MAGTGTTSMVLGSGSLFSNADLKIYGSFESNLAAPLGDQIMVAGKIGGADDNAQIKLNVATVNGLGVWQPPSTTIDGRWNIRKRRSKLIMFIRCLCLFWSALW